MTVSYSEKVKRNRVLKALTGDEEIVRAFLIDRLVNELDYKPDQIVVSTGAKQSIANTVQVLVNPGDDVLLVAPYWVSYSAIVTLAEGNPIEIRSDISNDFKISPTQLENAITESILRELALESKIVISILC